MATTGVTSDAVGAWIEANWHLDITLADWWQRLADAGYAFPHWPTGFGGSDMRASDASAIQQLLGTHGVIGPPTGNAPNMGVPTVLTHGTDDQKERFVKPVANGQNAWCQLFSKPGAGSEVTAGAVNGSLPERPSDAPTATPPPIKMTTATTPIVYARFQTKEAIESASA